MNIDIVYKEVGQPPSIIKISKSEFEKNINSNDRFEHVGLISARDGSDIVFYVDPEYPDQSINFHYEGYPVLGRAIFYKFKNGRAESLNQNDVEEIEYFLGYAPDRKKKKRNPAKKIGIKHIIKPI